MTSQEWFEEIRKSGNGIRLMELVKEYGDARAKEAVMKFSEGLVEGVDQAIRNIDKVIPKPLKSFQERLQEELSKKSKQ